MSRVMKIASRCFFFVFSYICLSNPAFSADPRRGALVQSEPASHSSRSTQTIPAAESPAGSLNVFSPLYAQNEPLLLLLSGIAMFAGATTVKKASSRGQRAGR